MVYAFSFAFGKKSSLILILVISCTIVIDSTIVKFSTFSRNEFPTLTNVGIFVTISAIFTMCSMVLLRFAKKSHSKYGYKHELILKYSYKAISLTQYLIIGILVLIILQMVFLKNYSILLLFSAVYITHLSVLLFLVLMVFILVGWFRSNRNYIVMLYAISFSLLSLNILISLLYLIHQLSYALSSIRPYPIHLFLVMHPASQLTNSFNTTLDVLSLLSFILAWIATAALLGHYRHRMGKIRYWMIISIPLVYFLFPFETYFANIFQKFMLDSSVIFGLSYIIVFSATKQVGGILFAMVFLTTSTIINRPKLRQSLIITAAGMAILFGSVEIDSLLYDVYPPYGLVTVSFMPIGSYLLLTGIFVSATFVSQDAELRKEFYKSAESRLSLLRTIGVTEMEKELEKQVKFVEKRSRVSEKEKELHLEEEELHLEEENVKEILHDVLNELYHSRDNNTE
jgi:hypothetical protein